MSLKSFVTVRIAAADCTAAVNAFNKDALKNNIVQRAAVRNVPLSAADIVVTVTCTQQSVSSLTSPTTPRGHWQRRLQSESEPLLYVSVTAVVDDSQSATQVWHCTT